MSWYDMVMMANDLENIAILNFKGVDYRCDVWNMNKNDAINRFWISFELDYKGSLLTSVT